MSGTNAATSSSSSATDEAPTAPTAKPLNILDAVCVLYFAASGQLNMLVDILTAANYRILLPAEVLTEVRNRATRNGWNIRDLDYYLNTAPGARIVEIPEITAAQPATTTLLAQVRSRHPNVVAGATGTNSSEDLGECVVITHGILAKRRNLDVVVSIDDLKGQRLATSHSITFFTIEDAFSLATEHGLLDTLSAREAYERLLPFGNSLPSWDAELKPRLKREHGLRKKAAKDAEAQGGASE